MIAVDTQILVYALRADAEFHQPALAALLGLAQGGQRWAIPWPCVHEFLAIATHPRIYTPPTPLALALQAMDVWIQSPGCQLIGEGPGYWETLQELSGRAKCRGPLVHDVRIAAICRHHRIKELWTADRDFSRFGGLLTHNPLV
jgi:toxin-antitoxin system PIN domain toxin